VFLDRFPHFAFVGAVSTGIQYLILSSLVILARADPVAASAIGFVMAAAANYLLNYRFTFRSTQPHGPALLKFITLASIGLLLNSAIMQLLARGALHYLLAQVVATGVVLLWNFFGNACWTFRSTVARRAWLEGAIDREERSSGKAIPKTAEKTSKAA
jgi:putative flippase GtrA